MRAMRRASTALMAASSLGYTGVPTPVVASQPGVAYTSAVTPTSHTSNVFTCTSRTSTLNHMQSTPIHMHFNARLVQAQHLHHARAHASQWSRPSQGLSTTAFTGTPTHMHKIRHHTYRHLQTHHSHSQAHLHHTQHLSTSTSTNPSTCNHLDTRHHVQAHHTCTKVTSKHIIYMINKHTSYKAFNIDAE